MTQAGLTARERTQDELMAGFPVVDYDPASGLVTKYKKGMDGKWHLTYEQDVEAALDHNKASQTANDGYSKSRELRRAAHIPDIVILKWMKEDGINIFDRNDWPKIKRKLNDPEWRYLRTCPGNI